MDSNYAFYKFFENLKNNLYKELSTASQYNIIWPKYFYSWFYVDERHYYNILNLRQKLGPKISDAEISEYNTIINQIQPVSIYRYDKKVVKGVYFLLKRLYLMALKSFMMIFSGKGKIADNYLH